MQVLYRGLSGTGSQEGPNFHLKQQEEAIPDHAQLAAFRHVCGQQLTEHVQNQAN